MRCVKIGDKWFAKNGHKSKKFQGQHYILERGIELDRKYLNLKPSLGCLHFVYNIVY